MLYPLRDTPDIKGAAQRKITCRCFGIIILISVVYLAVPQMAFVYERDGLPGPILLSPNNWASHIYVPVTLDWEDLDGAVKYQLQVDRDENFANPELDKLTRRSQYTADSLGYDTVGFEYLYYWRVRAEMNTAEWTNWSETWHFYTHCDVPRPPLTIVPLNESVQSELMVVFDWVGTAGCTLYNLWIDDDPEFWTPDLTAETTVSSFSTPDLLPETEYYWRVQGYSECNWGMWSEVWSFTTCSPWPGTELLFPLNEATNIAVPTALEWHESPQPSDFQLQIDLESDFVEPMVNISVSEPYFLADMLEYDNTYFWRIQATDGPCGVSEWSVIWCFATQSLFTCGDVDDNTDINILDIVFIINNLYKAGPGPTVPESADVNNDLALNILDIVYLINFIYKGGPEPDCP